MKTVYEDSFLYFLRLGSVRSYRKTIFSEYKIYNLFLNIVFY